MKILFLHDNFPAQFGAFGRYLAQEGWEVWFGTQRKGATMLDLKVFNYAPHRKVTEKIHPYAGNFERAVLAGQAMARVGLDLKKNGFSPDIVMAHSGWGPGLFVKDVWPDAKYIGYFEWYYRADAPDVAFLSEKERSVDEQLRARARNAAILMDLAHCDAGVCPTYFQKSQFPECFHDKLHVIHDGVDTDYYKPESGAKLSLPEHELNEAGEVITYVARGMEPYRGFLEFMKALEIILKERPRAHAVIVGEDRVAYGRRLPEDESYKQQAQNERDLDWGRVHFTGLLPRPQYRSVLQASSVHVYLTVPFVLSWSVLEAMSAGCAVVASDVDSVREISDAPGGAIMLADHTDPGSVAARILALLANPERAANQGVRAREFIAANFAALEIYKKKRNWLLTIAGADNRQTASTSRSA